MSPIRGIAEVVLNVINIEDMARFYIDIVGLRHYAQSPEMEPTIVFLEIAPIDRPLGAAHPMVLALIDPARHPPAQGRFDMIARRNSTLNHVAFEIDEAAYEAELHRLREVGISVSEQQFPMMRAKALFFRDPESNVIELICHDSSAPSH